MKCKIVPAGKEVWETYAGWVRAAGGEPQGRADGWIFVGVEFDGHVLASGARLWIDSESVGLGDFYANPRLTGRELYAIAVLTLRTAISFATMLGKQLRARAPTIGIERLLKRQGFRWCGEVMPGIWFIAPGLGSFEMPLPKRSPAVKQTREAPPAGKDEPPAKAKMPAAAVRVKVQAAAVRAAKKPSRGARPR